MEWAVAKADALLAERAATASTWRWNFDEEREKEFFQE